MQMLGFLEERELAAGGCCYSKHSEVRALRPAQHCSGHWGLLVAVARRRAQQLGQLFQLHGIPLPSSCFSQSHPEDAGSEKVWGCLCSLAPRLSPSLAMGAKGQELGFSGKLCG